MGGGGGSTGRVGYAAYLEGKHEDLITGGFATPHYPEDNLALILRDLFNSTGPQAPLGNPYLDQAPFDPNDALAEMFTDLADYKTDLDTLISDAGIDAEAGSFDVSLTARLDDDAVPKYLTLRRDICSVQADTFVTGKNILYDEKDREVNSYKVRTKFDRKRVFIQHNQVYTTMYIDVEKVRITANVDYENRDAELDRLRAFWRLDTLIKGAQFMGALGGGTAIPDRASKVESAVSMGLAGASAGAMVAGPWGAVAGGLVGVGASFIE